MESEQRTGQHRVATFEHFFDLPAEIRTQILSHLCHFPRGVEVGSKVGPSTWSPYMSKGPGWAPMREPSPAGPPLGLLLASSELYLEAAELYYGGNTFTFRLREYNPHPALADSETGLLLGSETRGVRRRIRSAKLLVKRLGGLVLDVAIPGLQDMLMNGHLKSLTVDIGVVTRLFEVVRYDMRGTLRRTGDLSKSPVLEALLRVLVDPELGEKGGRLRVSKGSHAKFWCDFHGPVPGHREINDVAMGAFDEDIYADEDGRDYLDVDVKKLVEYFGGDAAGFNIKKVEGTTF